MEAGECERRERDKKRRTCEIKEERSRDGERKARRSRDGERKARQRGVRACNSENRQTASWVRKRTTCSFYVHSRYSAFSDRYRV